jgi:hypothetical protein
MSAFPNGKRYVKFCTNTGKFIVVVQQRIIFVMYPPRLMRRSQYLIELVARPMAGDQGVVCLCLSKHTDSACNMARVISLSSASYVGSCAMFHSPDLLDSDCSLIRQKTLWWMNCWSRAFLYAVATRGSSNYSCLSRCAGSVSVADPKNPSTSMSIKNVR